MKKNLLLFSALAAMVFTGCQSDEPAVDNGNSQDGAHYMSVKIRTAGMGGSRAATVGTPEFEAGVGSESSVVAANIRFLFFDEAGNAFTMVHNGVNGTVNTNMVTPTEITTQAGEGNDAVITGTLVLGVATDDGYKGQTPSQVLVVANGDAQRLKDIENLNLSKVLDRVATTPQSWPPTPGFLMTSAVYYDGDARVAAVDITGCIKGTKKEAEATPAILYIERAAAKVRATYNTSYTVQGKNAAGELVPTGEFVYFDIDGTGKIVESKATFTAEINGWQLLNKAGQTAAFKDLPETFAQAEEVLGRNDASNWVWNDEARHRSYWANSNAGTGWIAPYTNAYGTDPLLERPCAYAKQSFNVANPTENIEYCYENTQYQNATVSQRATYATAITVKATIKKDGQALDMYRIAGEYYSKAAMEKLVKTAYLGSHGDLTEDVLEVRLSDNTEALDNTYTPVVYANGGATGTAMSQFSTTLWWKKGVTSYQINIMHLNGKPGVVRNHIYDYKIDGIVGLGVPGNEPNIPDLNETYLAARLYILDWHVVSNNVTLE